VTIWLLITVSVRVTVGQDRYVDALCQHFDPYFGESG